MLKYVTLYLISNKMPIKLTLNSELRSLNIHLRGSYGSDSVQIYQDVYKYIINHCRIPDVFLILNFKNST